MSPVWKVAGFVAQSVALGLAVAFIAVLIEPELINRDATVSPAPASYAEAVAASAPAVATIYTLRTVNAGPNAPGERVRDRALGSGVVIDRVGHVVTNHHVIAGADAIGVQLADGRVANPVLVGTDRDTELALLRIDLPDLPEIRLGRSDTLEVGDVVLAIGNSLGLSQTVTLGIVSATGRGLDIAPFEDFIQTDAAINAGNSGGALVNARGELVGISTAVISTAPESMPEGLGFAIPVNLVRGVMQQLIANGRVIRGYLGVDDACDLTAAQTRIVGIDGPAVLITIVTGPAERAGLKPGDVLTHLKGERTFTRRQALTLVASAQPGDRIRIRVTRRGASGIETVDAEAVLEERASETARGVSLCPGGPA